MAHSNWVIVKDSLSKIIIRDTGPWDQFMSVTNDAENVIKVLSMAGKLTEGKRVFYFDSEGALDELLVKNGEFTGFAPLSREEQKKTLL